MILNNPYQSSNSQNYLVQKNASLIAAKSLSKEKAKIATGESWMQEIDSTSSRRDNPYTRNSSQQFLRTSNYTPQTYGQPLSGSRYMSINDADAWKRQYENRERQKLQRYGPQALRYHSPSIQYYQSSRTERSGYQEDSTYQSKYKYSEEYNQDPPCSDRIEYRVKVPPAFSKIINKSRRENSLVMDTSGVNKSDYCREEEKHGKSGYKKYNGGYGSHEQVNEEERLDSLVVIHTNGRDRGPVSMIDEELVRIENEPSVLTVRGRAYFRVYF